MNYTYTYNGLDQRVAKNYTYTEGTSGITSVQTGQVIAYSKKYYYDHAGRLLAEGITKTVHGTGTVNERIVFLYDESSMVGMERTVSGVSTLYYFQRNLQGDVTAIFDTNGNLVAKYLYDAWGNCTISSETTNAIVANANPIRYRGYYYDDDTGLYYCYARYYSPKWRRFLSPDDTVFLYPENVNGLNLYCYCENDPVNFADPSGRGPIAFLLLAVLAGALSAGANVLGQVVFDGRSFDEINGWEVLAAGVAGFCAGLIPGTGFVSIAGQAIVSSFVEHGLNAFFSGKEIDGLAVAKDIFASFVAGCIVKGITHYTSRLTSKFFPELPNYSQYQHYFRSKGYNYTRQEVYVYMRRYMSCKRYSDMIVDKAFDFASSLLTYPV